MNMEREIVSTSIGYDFHYPNLSLWKSNNCYLLNDDFTMHEKTYILFYLPKDPCDEDVVGNTNMGVMYVSKDDNLQLITMRWPFMHGRLEGNRLPSKTILFCFEIVIANMTDDGLDKVWKNSY
jgi:hypothetical protein